ncbi:MAG: AHH domain-containing protein [Gammaproteobacteria bacterium]|nr:AHH domain-containing protein [Gammaproteobacteria bacterium]
MRRHSPQLTETKYIEVDPNELRHNLTALTGDATRASALLRDVVHAYETEAAEEILVRKGIKTREQVDNERRARIIGRSHSVRLRENMIAAGRKGPPNAAAHHVVAWDDKRANEARAILKQVGIDIDDEANGVFLPRWRRHTPHPTMPNAYAHLPVHTNVYFLNVTTMLREEFNAEGSQEDLKDVLRDIAKRLTNGTFPLHPTSVSRSQA